MNITELIERLTEVAESNPDAEVRLATQPNWPLAFHLAGVASPEDRVQSRMDFEENPEECEEHGHYHCEECELRELQESGEGDIVWLVEGGSVYDKPYAPRDLWEAAR